MGDTSSPARQAAAIRAQLTKCVEARAVTKSTGRRSSDMSVYVGFGGVALASAPAVMVGGVYR